MRALRCAAAMAMVAVAGLAASLTGSGPAIGAPPAPLTVGTALPNTGDLAAYGPATQAAVRLAIADVNAAGGVAGQDVRLLPGDSGDVGSAAFDKTLARLSKAGVPAVVGPMSSALMLAHLGDAEGMTFVSPATTSPDLSGRIQRVVPSDVLQGSALGRLAVEDRVIRLAIVAPKTSSGIARATASQARAGGVSIVAFPYPATLKDAASLAAAIAAKHPDGIAFAGGRETGTIIRALVRLGMPARAYFTSWAAAGAEAGSLPAGTLAGAKALAPDLRVSKAFAQRLRAATPGLTKVEYAPQAYDAAAVIVLAAAQSQQASGTMTAAAINAAIPAVTMHGQPCQSVRRCLELIALEIDIDYVGVSGPVDIAENGEPVSASYGVRTFGPGNKLGTYVRYVQVP